MCDECYGESVLERWHREMDEEAARIRQRGFRGTSKRHRWYTDWLIEHGWILTSGQTAWDAGSLARLADMSFRLTLEMMREQLNRPSPFLQMLSKNVAPVTKSIEPRDFYEWVDLV